jgi:hypothetical protein
VLGSGDFILRRPMASSNKKEPPVGDSKGSRGFQP